MSNNSSMTEASPPKKINFLNGTMPELQVFKVYYEALNKYDCTFVIAYTWEEALTLFVDMFPNTTLHYIDKKGIQIRQGVIFTS